MDTEQELARKVKYFQTNAPDYGRNLAAKKKSIILAIQNESDPDRVEGYCATFELAGAALGNGGETIQLTNHGHLKGEAQ